MKPDTARATETSRPNHDDLYALKMRAILGGLRRQHLSFWALSAYFLFEYVRPQSIYPALDILPWSQLFILLATGGALIDKSVSWISNIENKLICCFLFIIILSGLFAFRPATSWSELTLFINWFLVYFLVITVINTLQRFFLFLLIYLFANLKMAQHGFFEMARRGFAFEEWGLVGPPGWFGNSGEFAIQMLIFAAISGAFVVGLRKYWGSYKKMFFYFFPISAAMVVIGASSRGSQLALLAMGAWLLLKTRSGFKAFIVALVFMVVIFQFLPEEQKQRFAAMGEDNTSTQRLFYWEAGIDFIGDHPVLGVGYANWLDYYAYALPDAYAEGLFSLSHNIFIQAGAELGLSGLLCFLLMIFNIFLLNSRTRKKARQLDNDFLFFCTYGLDAGLIGYLVAGFFVTVLYYPFFWVQLAMTVALYNVTAGMKIDDKDARLDDKEYVQSGFR